jgi:hypothetical protein
MIISQTRFSSYILQDMLHSESQNLYLGCGSNFNGTIAGSGSNFFYETAGSGPFFKLKMLDPDPHLMKMLYPDPYKMKLTLVQYLHATLVFISGSDPKIL